jgi:hypothetical protein
MKKKMKSLLILEIIAWFVSLGSFAQTKLVVIGMDETEQTFLIAETGNLHFDETWLYIDEDANQSISIPFSAIRKIVFAPLETGISDNTAKKNERLLVYPNPVKESIAFIGATDEKRNVKIISLSGQLLLSGEYRPDEKINVSHFPSGFYLIRINEETLKFSKL